MSCSCYVRYAIAVSLLVLLLVPELSMAEISGLEMVGIGIPPDSLTAPRTLEEKCSYDDTSSISPGFTLRPTQVEQFDADVELLVSNSLTGTYVVDANELELLGSTFDGNLDNRLGFEETDLQLIFNYLSDDSLGYDDGLEVFRACTGELAIPSSERNHVDIYLTMLGTDDDKGQYECRYYSPLEDPAINPYEFHANAFQVTDSGGNAEEDTQDWPKEAAQACAHEFGHLLWSSNTASRPSYHTGTEGGFDEMFASVAGQTAGPFSGDGGSGDAIFSQSLLPRVNGSCNVFDCMGPACCPSWWDDEDCRARYRTRALWAAYMMEHLTDPDDYADDAAYRWARNYEPVSGRRLRDLCGLAGVLSDDGAFGHLGGEDGDGGYRLRKVFHAFNVAKWLDSDNLDAAYSFGDEFSPTASLGLFQKRDLDTGPYENCWELAIPPQFTLGAEHDGVLHSVPGNAVDPESGCIDGWNDPLNATFCDNEYCHPVRTLLWGADYIAFKADTDYYDTNKADRYLRIEVEWEQGAMHDSTELWVSVLRYPSAPDSTPLYLLGDDVSEVATYQFTPSDTGFVEDIWYFHEGGTEGAALVLSLLPSGFSLHPQDCPIADPPNPPDPTACLQRAYFSTPDLEYSYSFKVLQVGGGCPYVSSRQATGETSVDNNVLAGAMSGTDGTDYYRLEREPEALGGTYHLRFSEDERERSYFDRVELLALDRPAGLEACVLPGGEFRAYSRGAEPLACTASDGTNLLALVAQSDDKMAELPVNGWIDVDFPSQQRGGGGVGARGKPDHKYDPPRGGGGRDNAQEATFDLSPLCHRENACTSVLSFTDGTVSEGAVQTLRLTAPTEFYIDELFLVEFSEETPVVTRCELVSASHSASGSCLGGLIADDSERVELIRGQTIDFAFTAPTLEAGHVRDFVLVTEGYYERSALERGPDEMPTAAKVSTSAPFPNPTRGGTTIRFDITEPGGHVSVRVYNMAGRLVRDLGEDDLPSGLYEVEWDGRDAAGKRVAAGVYFYRVEVDGLDQLRKIVVLR